MTLAYSYVTWNARRFVQIVARRIGLRELVLTISIALSVATAAGWRVASLRHKAEALQRQGAIDAMNRQAASAVATSEPISIAQSLANFYKELPAEDDLPQAVADIFSAAAAHRLVLNKADYKLEYDARAKLLRYRMNLPLRGNALAIQRFVADAMATQRFLAFESIQFKRENRDSLDVEAGIQWTLLVRPMAIGPEGREP